MSFRKTLSLITVFVLSMFVLMLSSSYAWYSFTNASTTFDTLTSDEEIKVVYRNNKFISTVTAVPISGDDVGKLSEKNNFSIDVDNENIDEALSIIVKLTSIEIDSALKNNNFRYELLYNNSSVAKGNFSDISGDELVIASGIILNNLDANDFELRVFLLDDGSNQNNLMNKTFKAIITVNVISRVNVTLDNQGIDFLVKSIMIDGVESNYLPNSGRYTLDYNCEKNVDMKWDSLTRTIKVSSGNVINNKCNLIFKSNDSYDYLNSVVKSGDYVKYIGNNGCIGKTCEGVNINYVDDTNMGYCNNFNNKYIASGWRVLYVDDGSVYLVSAGGLDCVSVKNINELNNLALNYCNSSLVYNGVCDINSVRSISNVDFSKLLNSSLGDCFNSRSNKKCGYNNNLIDNGGFYWYSSDNNNLIYYWNPLYRSINTSNSIFGSLRPVIRLDKKVMAVSGTGEYDDPYLILAK